MKQIVPHKLNFYIFSPAISLIEKIIQLGNIGFIAIEKKHLSQDVVNLSNLWEIPLFYSNKLQELNELFLSVKNNSIGISYGTGFIFKDYHINAFSHGIINIHTGKLPDNRGRHPIAWSFYNCDKYFYLTSHIINAKIDQGIKLYEKKLFRSINETTESISSKINLELSNNFIEHSLFNLFSKKGKKIKKGNYNPPVTQLFNTINTDNFTAKQIFSIFKSQSIYGNVTVNGTQYKKCDFYNNELLYQGEYDIITVQNKQLIFFK